MASFCKLLCKFNTTLSKSSVRSFSTHHKQPQNNAPKTSPFSNPNIFKLLPKVELHCHLDGSIRPKTMVEIAQKENIDLPAKDEESMRKLVSVVGKVDSLEGFLEAFKYTTAVMQSEYSLARSVYEVAEDCAKDGVRYIEIRFSPILHTNNGLSLDQVMKAARSGIEKAHKELNIQVRLIVCALRNLSSKISEKLVHLAIAHKHNGFVVGFDLAGPELGWPCISHRSAFHIAQAHGLHRTLHAGEAASWKSIEEAIFECRAERIGHGTRLTQNKFYLEQIAKKKIPIESCVTSNLHTRSVMNINEHPLPVFLRAGIQVVPCTDDYTMSEITLSSEYQLIQKSFALDEKDIYQLIENGWNSTFDHSHDVRVLKEKSLVEARSLLNLN